MHKNGTLAQRREQALAVDAQLREQTARQAATITRQLAELHLMRAQIRTLTDRLGVYEIADNRTDLGIDKG